MNSCYSLLSHMPLFFRCTAPTILTTILYISWHSEAELLRWRRQTTSLARYIHIWSSPCPCNTTSNCIPLPSNQVAKRCCHGGTFGSSCKLCPAQVLRRLAKWVLFCWRMYATYHSYCIYGCICLWNMHVGWWLMYLYIVNLVSQHALQKPKPSP